MKNPSAAHPITSLQVSAYRIPTDHPEADGTIRWDKTTLILVQICSGRQSGLGYTYAGESAGRLIHETLRQHIEAKDAFDIPSIWLSMVRAVRNLGRPGEASEAIAAVDIALWDLK